MHGPTNRHHELVVCVMHLVVCNQIGHIQHKYVCRFCLITNDYKKKTSALFLSVFDSNTFMTTETKSMQ